MLLGLVGTLGLTSVLSTRNCTAGCEDCRCDTRTESRTGTLLHPSRHHHQFDQWYKSIVELIIVCSYRRRREQHHMKPGAERAAVVPSKRPFKTVLAFLARLPTVCQGPDQPFHHLFQMQDYQGIEFILLFSVSEQQLSKPRHHYRKLTIVKSGFPCRTHQNRPTHIHAPRHGDMQASLTRSA